ncbi:hypothetical protein HMPREF1985_00915 [Mitsuokella sp. oral taxon 131 str. W9106]|nr:hypothetical protein HMPREF1985_00915 [Mitsuokella sp. oral taxon 131 str. W9106]
MHVVVAVEKTANTVHRRPVTIPALMSMRFFQKKRFSRMHVRIKKQEQIDFHS